MHHILKSILLINLRNNTRYSQKQVNDDALTLSTEAAVITFIMCKRQKYLDIYSTSVYPSSSILRFTFIVQRISNKILTAILTAYHKSMHVPCLTHVLKGVLSISQTPSKQVTSVLLITARAGKLFVRTNQGRRNSLIAPLGELLQSYYTAFLTVIGAEEPSAVLKLQLGEQNVSAFI